MQLEMFPKRLTGLELQDENIVLGTYELGQGGRYLDTCHSTTVDFHLDFFHSVVLWPPISGVIV